MKALIFILAFAAAHADTIGEGGPSTTTPTTGTFKRRSVDTCIEDRAYELGKKKSPKYNASVKLDPESEDFKFVRNCSGDTNFGKGSMNDRLYEASRILSKIPVRVADGGESSDLGFRVELHFARPDGSHGMVKSYFNDTALEFHRKEIEKAGNRLFMIMRPL